MHIRHLICTDNFAGVEAYVAATATELARRGHTVDVIGGAPVAMAPLLAPAGVGYVPVSTTLAVARAAARRPRPDLTHAHMTAADVAVLLAKPFVRRPIVSTLHFAQPRGHSQLTRAVYSVIPRLVTAQIAISQSVADAVGADADDPAGGPVTVIPNGVPAPAGVPDGAGDDTAGDDTAGTGQRGKVVLVVQRLESEKDTATAVRAFAESGLADDGWQLHIAGEGSERRHLIAMVERLGLAHSVEFLGRVVDVGARMRTASLLLASASWEPFGLAVVEAMAHGMCVVAADGGGHRETIGTATPETLFAPGDAAAAGRLLAELAADSERRVELGARARRRYEGAFTIEAHVDALETFYQHVIST